MNTGSTRPSEETAAEPSIRALVQVFTMSLLVALLILAPVI